MHFLTQCSAPGSPSFFLPTLPSRLCLLAPSQSQSYKNGPCTGQLLAPLSLLNTSQSGSLAGIFLSSSSLEVSTSDSCQKAPVLLGNKNFVLVISIFATDSGQSPRFFFLMV